MSGSSPTLTTAFSAIPEVIYCVVCVPCRWKLYSVTIVSCTEVDFALSSHSGSLTGADTIKELLSSVSIGAASAWEVYSDSAVSADFCKSSVVYLYLFFSWILIFKAFWLLDERQKTESKLFYHWICNKQDLNQSSSHLHLVLNHKLPYFAMSNHQFTPSVAFCH